MLNIPSYVNDPNYRYRMPKMQLKIQSKGNGIKTNIVNLADIAKYVRTNESYILKFFGFEKATQIQEKVSQNKSNKNVKGNTSYIIQGSFSEEELLKTLDKFIQKYVLCPKCKLPEINMSIIKDRVHGKCNSCPFSGELPDNKHRVVSVMIKNPPTERQQESKIQQKINSKMMIKEEGKIYEEQQSQEVDTAIKLFETNNLEFGSEELQNFINYLKQFIEKRQKEDFDIVSAETIHEIRPLKLKGPIYAYVLFNTFFTINIHKQIQQYGALYQNLMKKLGIVNIEFQSLLNLQYLFLQTYKDKDFTKNLPTIMMKLFQNKFFSQQFIKEWSTGQIKSFDTFYLYNEERNAKFMQICKDFITYATEEEEQQDEEDD